MTDSSFIDAMPRSMRDEYANIAVHLLGTGDISRLTVRAVAQALRVTPPAISQRYRRDELLVVILGTIGHRYVSWSRAGFRADLPGNLPGTAEEVHGVRVWRALLELSRGAAARGNPALEEVVVHVLEKERDDVAYALFRRLGRRPTGEELTSTLALLEGARADLVGPAPQLTLASATALLHDHVGRLGEA